MNFVGNDEDQDEVSFNLLHGKSGPGLNISLKIGSTSSFPPVPGCRRLSNLQCLRETVHDLPQIYTRPPAQDLLDALDLLQKPTSTFGTDPSGSKNQATRTHVDPSGVPRYLTSIIGSSLEWLAEDDQERIWELASLRLSERSGRSAASAMTRSFKISDNLTLSLHEPSLTEDNLGLKTWTSSLLLSRRLAALSKHVPAGRPRVLELGSGTGLVGLAAASTWQDSVSEVMLTDLPEIVPNLQKNIELNQHLLRRGTPRVQSRVLDWSDMSDVPKLADEAYAVILAADPIYSPEHPTMLTDTVRRWLQPAVSSRFVVELPLREAYVKERQDLRQRLEKFMEFVEEDEEVGYDDWETADGRQAEVTCWWSVWQLKSPD